MGASENGFSADLILRLNRSLTEAGATKEDVERLCIGLAIKEGLEPSKQWGAKLVRTALANVVDRSSVSPILSQADRPMVLHLLAIGQTPVGQHQPQTTEADICRSGHLGNIVVVSRFANNRDHNLVVRLENLNLKKQGEWIWDFWDRETCTVIAQGVASNPEELLNQVRPHLID